MKAHEEELRASGVARLSLFGSMARGEETEASDIDLLADFDAGRALSLLDIVHIENRLCDILGKSVDLIEESTLRPTVRERAMKSVIRAF